MMEIRSVAMALVVIERGTDRVLLLRRANTDSFPGEWFYITGSVEEDETAAQAALRELFEETALTVEELYSADLCEQFYEPDRGSISVMPVFCAYVSKGSEPKLNDEHDAWEWLDVRAASQRVCLGSQRHVLAEIEREFVSRVPSKHLKIELDDTTTPTPTPDKARDRRQRPFIAVHLFLQRAEGAEVLWLLRDGTGWMDGRYSVIAGHVDALESASSAMIREAREEAGIELTRDDLTQVLTMHRASDTERIDLFFLASSWSGTPRNMEPDKCAGLAWSTIDTLEQPLVGYIEAAWRAIQRGESYIEHGW